MADYWIWFSSFFDIPGIKHQPWADNSYYTNLYSGSTMKLKFAGYSFDPSRQIIVWENLPVSLHSSGSESGYYSSPSVILRQKFFEENDIPTKDLIEKTCMILSVPGIPDDYRHGLYSVVREMEKRKEEEPWVIDWIEFLSVLNIDMIELFPYLVIKKDASSSEMSQFNAEHVYKPLIDLYMKEGFLAPAADLERRCSAVSGIDLKAAGPARKQEKIKEKRGISS